MRTHICRFHHRSTLTLKRSKELCVFSRACRARHNLGTSSFMCERNLLPYLIVSYFWIVKEKLLKNCLHCSSRIEWTVSPGYQTLASHIMPSKLTNPISQSQPTHRRFRDSVLLYFVSPTPLHCDDIIDDSCVVARVKKENQTNCFKTQKASQLTWKSWQKKHQRPLRKKFKRRWKRQRT